MWIRVVWIAIKNGFIFAGAFSRPAATTHQSRRIGRPTRSPSRQPDISGVISAGLEVQGAGSKSWSAERESCGTRITTTPWLVPSWHELQAVVRPP
jgi:hypothetical protein